MKIKEHTYARKQPRAYDYDQDYQEHDEYQDGNQNIPQDGEDDDYGNQDNDDEGVM